MRKYFYLILCFFGIAACQKAEELEPTSGVPLTRSITTSISPVFDWWDTTSISLLGMQYPVVLPWYNGSNTQIPYYLLEDYRPEDGWEMVYNYCINGIPGEVNKNYLLFYNKFTGILRVFYYNINQIVPATASFWKFEITAPTSMLNATGVISVPMSERIENPYVYVSNLTGVPSKSISMGWNCFDLELAYDEQIVNTNARFNINIYNIDQTAIRLDGDINLETEGTIVTTVSSSFPSWVKDASKAAGKSSKDFVEKLLSETFLKDRISSIISGGASALISNGVTRLLGSFVGKKDNNYNSHVKLTSTGKIKLTGNMEALNLPNISTLMNNSMPGAQKRSDDNFLSSYDVPLGVWALEESPRIYTSHAKMWKLDKDEEIHQLANKNYVVTVQQEELLYYYEDSVKIKINPAVLECVEKYDVKTECVWTIETKNPANFLNQKGNYLRGDCHIYTDSSILLSSTGLPPIAGKPHIMDGKSGYTFFDFRIVPVTEREYNELMAETNRFPLLDNSHVSTYEVEHAIKNEELVFKVTVTLYPKSPYEQTPIVSMRTYPLRSGGIDRSFNPGRWPMISF